MRKITFALTVVALLGATAWCAPAAHDAKGDTSDKKVKPRFPVGKETTYVNEPLDKGGYIDYIAALNERLRHGVTADNNAYVLLCKALGPRPEGFPMPDEFYRWLGIPAPPEKGDYFIFLYNFVQDYLKLDPNTELEKLHRQQDRAAQRPWTAKDYPELAGWLRVNDKPLALIVEATQRTHYFSPLVPPRGNEGPALIGALLSGPARCREAGLALACRAMLRVHDGRPADAWQDVLACHRLARLLARGGSLFEGVVGATLDRVAHDAALGWLGSTKADAKVLKACLRELQQLPAMPGLADKVELCERFSFLDTVMVLDRQGLAQLEKLFGGDGKEAAKRKVEINWEPALRIGNRWCDRLTAALRVADRARREQQLDAYEKDHNALRQKIKDENLLDKALADKTLTPQKRGEILGDVLAAQLLHPPRKFQEAADRSEQLQRNRHVAFVLALYQRDQGTYPKKLEDLAPTYLAEIPVDLFTGKALKYVPSNSGYSLYSFGVNGRDDQGRTSEDNPPGDDLAVRMPLPKLPEK
jgi:hypothetical protein